MKLQFSLTFLLSLLFLDPHHVEGANILFYHTVGTSSHRTSIWPLVERLADKGHNVTYIFPVNKRLGFHPKVEEITPSKMTPLVEEYVGNFDINHRLNHTVNDWTYRIFSKCLELCEAFYDSPETQKWLARPGLSYDLIVIDQTFGECAYGLVHRFKAKHVTFVPVLPAFLWDGFGIVPETSSIPDVLFNAKPRDQNFVNRFLVTVTVFVWRLAFLDYMYKVGPIIKEKLSLSELPEMPEFERNTSLVMLNSHFVEDYPMAFPPLFVSYSGLWCSKDKLKETKPLPEKISSFIKGADSFIYVSFGSAIVVSGMPEQLRDMFFKGFAAFPNIKFLWRWTGEVPDNTPKNLLLLPWFPQRDLLAHPKIKAFITQAGRPSTQEALCYGVPMITFPVFADQDLNANRLEYIGVSISLDINSMTTEALREGIEDILKNSTYRKRVKELSSIFRDRPIDPLDNTLYWIEYVLRHDTSLMKPLGMNQTWWQRRLFDVYAALAVLLSVLLGIILRISYAILKCLGGRVYKLKRKTE